MEFVNLILFFIYTFGIGFTISSILKLKYKDYLEITFINIGLGLAGFLVVGVLLNLLHIPLDWKIFLLISLIGPLYWASKNYNKIFTWNFNFPKKIRMSNIFGLIVLALFLFTVLMYSKGAFSYPWLEDGDPWTHLMGVKYISEEKTVFEPVEGIDYFFYIDPYPPGFDMLLGVMNQTSGDIVWTLKFFNILIISLAIPFSYFFFGKLTKSSSKALIGTFILAVLPSFMSHFIWAHSLAITLVPLIFYAALSIEEDHKWSYAAALFLGSSTLVQPTQPIKFIALFIIFSLVKSFSNKGIWKQYTKVLFIGGILGLLWWGPLILQSGGLIDTAENFRGSSIYVEDKRVEKPYYGSLGTATRFYHWQDFFLLDYETVEKGNKVRRNLYSGENMINSPVGLGIFASSLMIIGILFILLDYKSLNPKRGGWKLFTLLWFIFAFAGLYGGTVLPVALFSFRFWPLLSFPVAIIGAEGFQSLMNIFHKVKSGKLLKSVLFIILILGLIYTSGIPKYKYNSVQWYPDGTFLRFGQFNEYFQTGKNAGYMYLLNLQPANVLYACNHEFFYPNGAIIAFGHNNCLWCNDVQDFQKRFVEKTAAEIKDFMTEKNYQYLMFDGLCSETADWNLIQQKINELVDGLLTVEHQTDGVLILKNSVN